MEKGRLTLALALIAVLAVIYAFKVMGVGQVATTYTLTVSESEAFLVDSLGRSMTLNASLHRVASLAPSITEALCMLGACDSIVAADSFSKQVEGVPANSTDVGGYWSPSVEKIVASKPQIVLACSGVPRQEALARQLESMGLKVFFLRCDRARDWKDIEQDVMSLSLLLGLRERGEQLVRWMEEQLSMLSKDLNNTGRVNVTLIVYFSPKGIWVAGGGTFQDTLLASAGALNTFHDLYGWQMVGFEELASRNPGFIIATVPSAADAEKVVDALRKPPFSSLSAVRDGRVCIIYGDGANAVNRPSPRAVLAARLIASLVHPGVVRPPPQLNGTFICVSPGG